MLSFARAHLLLAPAALLLGGCQMSMDRSAFSRAQRSAMTSEGFVETSRGWEFSMNDRLLFATDQDTVQPEQSVKVRRIGQRLLAVDLRHAAVEGHADDTGSAVHNDQLSKRRAEAVADELAASGFQRANLSAVGLGERFPVDNDRSRDGRRQNRRVVILITAP